MLGLRGSDRLYNLSRVFVSGHLHRLRYVQEGLGCAAHAAIALWTGTCLIRPGASHTRLWRTGLLASRNKRGVAGRGDFRGRDCNAGGHVRTNGGLTAADFRVQGYECRVSCAQVRRPNNYDVNVAVMLGPTEPDPTMDLSQLDIVKTVVQDSPHKLFIGGLPCDWNEDQVRRSCCPPMTWCSLAARASGLPSCAAMRVGHHDCQWYGKAPSSTKGTQPFETFELPQ